MFTYPMFGGGGGPLLTGLLHWYTMDEAAGASREDSHGSLALTEVGVTTPVAQIVNGGRTGVYFQDAKQNGLESAAESIDWSLGVTIAGWFYQNLFGSFGVNRTAGAVREGYQDFNGNGLNVTWRVYNNTASGNSTVTNTNARNGNGFWSFCAFLYDPSTKKAGLRIDENAVEWASTAVSTHPATQSTVWEFGRSAVNYAWDGNLAMDNIGIWNRCLSGDELSDLYNSGAGLTYSDLS